MKNQTTTKTIIQLLALGAFVALLFLATYPITPGFPYDLFFLLDPLVALASELGSWQLPCLAVVVLTLLAGRLFCGYICPLGGTIDLSDALALRNRPVTKEDNQRHRRLRSGKYYLLMAVIVSSVFGFGLLYALDPISLLTRSFTLFLYPLAVFLANLCLDLVRPLAESLGFIGLAHAHFIQPVFGSNLITFLIFIGILMLVFMSRRFWCRYLCPLGALLGILSLVSPIRRRVDKGCSACGLCQESCPMDAIKKNPRQTVPSECIGCRTCAKVCPEEVVRFVWTRGDRKSRRLEVDLSRRGLIASGGAALSLAFLARTNLVRGHEGNRLLRPPGALPEEWFNSTCVRCGACVKACITNTLQPCGWESGFEGLWTPEFVMRLGGCEQSCNACGHVCPTHAIRALPLEEKKHARIGTAVLKREKCIAWEQNKLCLKCDEACPYNAIVFKMIEGQKRPVVDELKCNGCGICEHVCPILGDAAIVVKPMGQIRLREGSYIQEAEQLHLQLHSQEEHDQWEESLGGSVSGARPSAEAPPPSGSLPPGFLP